MTNIPSTSAVEDFNENIPDMSTEAAEPLKKEDEDGTRPEEMCAQVEEGELPEDGEIMDEEEEVTTAASIPSKNLSHTSASSTPRLRESSRSSRKPPSVGSQLSRPSTNSSASALANKQVPSAKYRDYDSKPTKQTSSQDAMLNSWVTGVQKKSGKASSPRGTDPMDPNEEYYGASKTSGVNEDKQALGQIAANQNDSTAIDDKDFRMEEGLVEPEVEGEFTEDSDYRRMPNSPIRGQDSRRRRRSGSTDDYQNARFPKRQRGDSPPSQMSTGRFRGRNMIRPRWAEHTICKFFREGFCRDGDECAYSHNTADSHRRTDLCKYYQHGYCKKGLACLHLHGEYPCKAFHKGECSKDQCQYSHQPLNEFTQPIFDQMMRDEELASRISLPSHPLRRKVLLPLGPDTSMQESQPSADQSYIPPPTVVVPVLSSTPAIKREEKAMAAAGTYGFFNPITPMSASSTQHQPTHMSQFGSPPTNSFPSQINAAQSVSSMATPTPSLQSSLSQASLSPRNSPVNAVKVEPKQEPAPEPEVVTGGFNINQMLEQITQQVTASSSDMLEEVDDSPASPPASFSEPIYPQDTKMIPVVRAWKLYSVEVEANPELPFDLRLAQSSAAYKNDPRVKKIAEAQFDMTSMSITKSLEQHNLAASQKLSPGSSQSSGTTSAATAGGKLADPRTKDPRKKAIQKSNQVSNSDSPAPLTPTFQQLIEQQIQMANQLAQNSHQQQHTSTPTPTTIIDDVDHRPVYGGIPQPNHPAQPPANGANFTQMPAYANYTSAPGYFGNNNEGHPAAVFGIADPKGAPVLASSIPFATNNQYDAANTSAVFSSQGFMGNRDDSSPNFQANSPTSTSFYNEGNEGQFRGAGGPPHREYRGSRGQGNRYNGGGYNNRGRARDYHSRQSDNDQQQQSRWEQPGGYESPTAAAGFPRHSSSNRHMNQQNGGGGSGKSSPNYNTETTTSAAADPSSSDAPLSLREKRKNNEYESPLARVMLKK